jgi:hypothetical protein
MDLLWHGAEGVQLPIIIGLVMAKNIQIAVICHNLETLIVNAIPPVQDIFDFKDLSPGLPSQREAERPLICLIARVTLDLEMDAHGNSNRSPRGPGGPNIQSRAEERVNSSSGHSSTGLMPAGPVNGSTPSSPRRLRQKLGAHRLRVFIEA